MCIPRINVLKSIIFRPSMLRVLTQIVFLRNPENHSETQPPTSHGFISSG